MAGGGGGEALREDDRCNGENDWPWSADGAKMHHEADANPIHSTGTADATHHCLVYS